MQNHYIQQALCAPSRMSMFSGLRPDTTKVWDLKASLLTECPDAVTMQQLFKENGYETTGSGKVMHGADKEHPASWSIPFMHKGQLPYAEGYPVPAHENCFYQGEKEHEVYQQMLDADIPRSDWRTRFEWMKKNDAMPSTECLDVPDDAYVDGAQTTWQIEQMEKLAKKDKPFFITVGYCKPHLPFVAPKKYWDLYDRSKIKTAPYQWPARNSPDYAYHNWELPSYTDVEKGEIPQDQQKQLIHGYYACVSYVDAQIGRLLDKLDELGIGDNTIIVLWGDHGWHLGDHGLWCKHTTFEEATKSPLIFVAPGMKAGQKAVTQCESVDIYPTLCELAGLEPYDMIQGKSLVPALKDPSVIVRDFAISQQPRYGRMGYTLRTERYRLTMWMKNDWRTTQPFDESLVETTELYDYEKDPLETASRQNDPDYQDVLKKLKGKMVAFFKEQEL